MTQIQTEQPAIRNTQNLPTATPNVRSIGENSAGSFDDLFAEKTALELVTDSSNQLDEVRDPSADGTSQPESDTESGDENPDADSADRENDQSETQTKGDQQPATGSDSQPSDVQSDADPDSAATQTEAGSLAGVESESVEGIGTQGGPAAAGETLGEAPPAVPTPERAIPVTGQAQVRHELKNAANIDLASLARQELLGSKTQTPDSTNSAGDRAPSEDRAAPRSPVPSSRPEQGPAQTGANPATPSEGGKPPPGFQPPSFRPDTGATHTVSNQVPGKTPSDGTNPLRAAEQQRSAGNGPSGSSDAAVRADAAAAKGVFLERLANAGSARRGAVSAAERTFGIDRAMTATESKPTVQHRVSFKPAEPPAPTRDAFLSPVQKGLGRMLAEGGGRLTVMLRPQELGDVRIAMETKQGAVRVKMEASSDAARRVLESGLDSLRSTLESRGVRVESMDVTSTDRQDASDADARGGGSARDGNEARGDQRDHQSRASVDNQTEPDTGRAGLTDSQTKQLWTELGIDAVA